MEEKKPKESLQKKSVAKPQQENKTQEPNKKSASAQNTIVTMATKRVSVQAWQVAVAVVVALALIVGAVYLGTLLVDRNEDDPIVDYTGELNNGNATAPDDITLPGYPALIFAANSKKVALELPNPMGNPCYFCYTLTIVETGEEIYKSEFLDPGKALQTITLNQALSSGTYTLRIQIDTYSLADGTTPMNGGVQEVKLTVK